MRCAAHTLQFAIFDTLKAEKKPLNRVIEKIKNVVIKLRTPENRKKLRSVNGKVPILANATRLVDINTRNRTFFCIIQYCH